MPISTGTLNLSRYQAAPGQVEDLFGFRLPALAFQSIDDCTDEKAAGWVHPDDWLQVRGLELGEPDAGDWARLGLRYDQRKIKPAVLRKEIAKAEAKAREEGGGRLGRGRRQEIRDRVRLGLLARTTPEPRLVEAAWNVATGELLLGSTSRAERSAFEDLFSRTFEVAPRVITPPRLGLRLLGSGPAAEVLRQELPGSGDALAQMAAVPWIGPEWLTWCWQLAETDGGFTLPDGETVDVLLGDKLTLGPAPGQEGNRVSVDGREPDLAEARTALGAGKLVYSIRLGLVLAGDEFWLTLTAPELLVTGLKLPAAAPAEDGQDLAGLWLERIAMVRQALAALDWLLGRWLAQRMDPQGRQELLTARAAWMALWLNEETEGE